MITNFKVNNYKAFREVDIQVRPITVFLGANSVGKSSIMQWFSLLFQTAQNKGNEYYSALSTFGEYINIGNTRNLFYRQKVKEPIGLSISFTSEGLYSLLCELKKMFKSSVSDHVLFESANRHLKLGECDTLDGFKQMLTDHLKSENKRYGIFGDKLVWDIRYFTGAVVTNLTKENRDVYENLFTILSKLREALMSKTSCEFSLEYKIKYKDNYLLTISEVSFKVNDNVCCKIVKNGNSIEAFSDFAEFSEDDICSFTKALRFDNTIFECIKGSRKLDDEILTPLTGLFLNVFYMALSEFKLQFERDKVNFITPLRPRPRRYYLLDQANKSNSVDTSNGEQMVEMLKNNDALKKSVNTWFENFGMTFNVEEFKEVIHKLKVNQLGFDLDFTDVGFGISQVLPVILQGFVSPTDSLTLVEQPEVHLHPNMQAKLAELFIDIVNNNKKKMIIETHSEYLLKRLRRKIVEGKIKADDVAIYIFYPQKINRPATVKRLDSSNTGLFDWPEDFYSEELDLDTISFIMN